MKIEVAVPKKVHPYPDISAYRQTLIKVWNCTIVRLHGENTSFERLPFIISVVNYALLAGRCWRYGCSSMLNAKGYKPISVILRDRSLDAIA